MPFNKSLTQTALIVSVIAMSSCATTRPAISSDTPSFGKASAVNLSAQIVAPTEAQKKDTYIPANRARRELAYEAYETDTIAPLPESVTTD